MAVRFPIPPIRGKGKRKPNMARLGMVWAMLAKPSAQRRAPAIRASITAPGSAMALEIAMVIETNCKCSIERDAISDARRLFTGSPFFQNALFQRGEKCPRLGGLRADELRRRQQHINRAVFQQRN